MWYQNIASRPAGWEVCDGTNGTPDLRGKFVIGAAVDSEVRTQAGADSHKHSNSNAQAGGAHTHTISGNLGAGAVNAYGAEVGSGGSEVSRSTHGHSIGLTIPNSGTHDHTIPDTGSVDNLPPYLQVHYIMRIV